MTFMYLQTFGLLCKETIGVWHLKHHLQSKILPKYCRKVIAKTKHLEAAGFIPPSLYRARILFQE